MRPQILSLLLCIALLAACGGGNTQPESNPDDNRHFKMGFTPWLYEASFTAQDVVYDQIQNNGDIISHHLMSGIPWQQALEGAPYPANLEQEIATRLSKTSSDQAIYLSIDSLNGLRTELAPNWGEDMNEPRVGEWATRTFSSPEVITAYGNFALDMINRFEPDYFNYAVEISVLMFNNPDEFNEFIIFSEAIYNRIKSTHPDLPLLVSLSLKSPGNAEMQVTKTSFERIANFVDIAGISIYPYAFFDHADKGDPSNMPSDWLSQISVLAPSKPIAITEVAWAAENLVLPTFSINLPVTSEQQNEFLNTLFTEATNNNASFIIWFSINDYDTLWETLLAEGDIARIWRDTGLFDENLNPRISLDTWQHWYQKNYNP